MLTSFISYQKNIYYHSLDGEYYISITERYIQPFYNTISLFVWFIGIALLTIFTYSYFRNCDDPLYKKYSVDYKLLFKSIFIFITILFSIGLFGEFFPSFYIGEDTISFITETEYREKEDNFNMSVDEFNRKYWTEV